MITWYNKNYAVSTTKNLESCFECPKNPYLNRATHTKILANSPTPKKSRNRKQVTNLSSKSSWRNYNAVVTQSRVLNYCTWSKFLRLVAFFKLLPWHINKFCCSFKPWSTGYFFFWYSKGKEMQSRVRAKLQTHVSVQYWFLFCRNWPKSLKCLWTKKFFS